MMHTVSHHRRVGLALVVAIIVAMSATACGGTKATFGSSSADVSKGVDYEFTIPAGTAKRIAAGEEPHIIPHSLDAKVGDVIRIINQDNVGQQVGPFYVGANEELVQQFKAPGKYEGVCAIAGKDPIILRVTAE